MLIRSFYLWWDKNPSNSPGRSHLLNELSIVKVIQAQPLIVNFELLNENEASVTFRPQAPSLQKRFGPKTFSTLRNISKHLMHVSKRAAPKFRL